MGRGQGEAEVEKAWSRGDKGICRQIGHRSGRVTDLFLPHQHTHISRIESTIFLPLFVDSMEVASCIGAMKVNI